MFWNNKLKNEQISFMFWNNEFNNKQSCLDGVKCKAISEAEKFTLCSFMLLNKLKREKFKLWSFMFWNNGGGIEMFTLADFELCKNCWKRSFTFCALSWD